MLILVSQENSSHAIPVEASPFLIGKDDTCHLQIAAPHVSNPHAGIVNRDGRSYLFDMGSRNGTFLLVREKAGAAPELRRVASVEDIHNPTEADWQQATELRPGMQIAFAGVIWNCRSDQVIAEAAVLSPSPRQSEPENGTEVELEVLTGPEPGRILKIREFPCTIGRSAAKANLAFEDVASVSRVHARLQFDEKKRLCLEDMQSRNGTYLNDRLIGTRIVYLSQGDRIRLSKDLVFKIRSGSGKRSNMQLALLIAAAGLAVFIVAVAWPRGKGPDNENGTNPPANQPHQTNVEPPVAPPLDEPQSLPSPPPSSPQPIAGKPEVATNIATIPDPLMARRVTCLDLIAQEKFHEALVVLRSVNDRSATPRFAPLNATLDEFEALIGELGQPEVPAVEVARGWHERMAALIRNADLDAELIRTYEVVFKTVLNRRAASLMAEAQGREAVLVRLYRLRVVQVMSPDYPGLSGVLNGLEQEGGLAFRDAIERANRDYQTGNTVRQRQALETYRRLLPLCAPDDWTREFLRVVKPWAESDLSSQ